MPFKEFHYGTTGYDDSNDYDDDNDNDKNEMGFNAQQLDQLPITTTLFPGIDNTASPAVVHALMECICANERHAVMVLQHDVEHRCIVELLKILEDAQCPDYMLHKVLMWAYIAKSCGFDFNPKAMSRKANIQWMYQALQHSHHHLPQVISIALEDQGVNPGTLLQKDHLTNKTQ